MEKHSKKEMLKVIEDFLKSKPEESFSHGVIAKTYKKANKEQLKHMAKVLLEWAGTFLWEQGYELDYGKDIEWTAENYCLNNALTSASVNPNPFNLTIALSSFAFRSAS